MLFEGAIADSFGAGFEFTDPQFVKRHLHANRYIQHPRHRGKPGRYTDDTQMSVALAELLADGVAWTEENIANKFVEVYKRDSRQGYSRHFYALLNEVKDGDELRAKINPDSQKTGAAMRAGVIGFVLTDIDQIKEYAEIQARVTHNTPLGIAAAQASALTSFFLHNTIEHKKHLQSFLNERVPLDDKNWKDTWTEPVGSLGVDAVHAAVVAIVNNDSLNGLLRACVAFTGDVDTVATIALQAACGRFEQDLPVELIDGLENEAYGRDFLRGLDEKLIKVKRENVLGGKS